MTAIPTLTNDRLPFGCAVVDNLLGGGIERDAITTIYGPAGTGKTNLALHAVISCVNEGKKVIYVDTEGGFSITRLSQIAKNHQEILEQVLFVKPTTFDEQVKAFDDVKTLATSKNVGLIIVDTISMLYRLERSSGVEAREFNRELGVQIVALTKIAREKNIPILITNQVYTSFDNGGVHMVGGDMLKYGSKCLLELQTLPDGKRKCTLKKHRSLPANGEALYEITQTGIIGAKTGFSLF